MTARSIYAKQEEKAGAARVRVVARSPQTKPVVQVLTPTEN